MLSTPAAQILADLIMPLACAACIMLLWSARRSSLMHCQRCGYRLLPEQNLRCSECGTVCKSERCARRPPRFRTRIAAAVLVVVVPYGALAGFRMTTQGWNGIIPTTLLLANLTYGSAGSSTAEILQHRILNQQLTWSQWQLFTHWALPRVMKVEWWRSGSHVVVRDLSRVAWPTWVDIEIVADGNIIHRHWLAIPPGVMVTPASDKDGNLIPSLWSHSVVRFPVGDAMTVEVMLRWREERYGAVMSGGRVSIPPIPPPPPPTIPD